MNNLKKMLALSLAATTIFSTAASATFTDSSEISNTTAVQTLVNLGVINGKPDGSFDPTGTVDRASMAKMIFVIMNNGSDDQTSWKDVPTELNDVNGHWAEGYIKFCEWKGIIAGRGNGSFDPDAEVTGVEAYKMALVALGYKSETLEGSSWYTNTWGLALDNRLDRTVSQTPGATLERQNAAQVLNNAIYATTVEWNTIYEIYVDGPTLGSEYMGLNVVSTTTVKSSTEDGGLVLSGGTTDVNATVNFAKAGTFFNHVTTDYSEFVGQEVDVLYGINRDDEVVIYSLTPSATTSSIKAQASDVTFNSSYTTATYNGVTISLVDADAEDVLNSKTLPNSDVYIVLNNSEDDAVATVTVTPVEVSSVAYVSEDSDTLIVVGYDEFTISEITLDDVVAGDLVEITENAYTELTTITKLTAVDGVKVTLKNPTNAQFGGLDSYVIGGETYYLATEIVTDLTVGTEYDLLVVGSVVYSAEEVTEDAVVNLATLVKVDEVYTTPEFNTTTSVYVKGLLAFADGTTEVINITTVDGLNVDPKASVVDFADFDEVEEHFEDNYTTDGNTLKLVEYSIDANGYASISAVETDEDGYNVYDVTEVTSTGTLSGYVLNDDAVVYVLNNSTVTIYTGKEVKAWGETTVVGSVYSKLQSTGLNRVEIAVLSVDSIPGETTGETYSYVTSNYVETQNDDGVNVYRANVWNGTETVVLDLVKGTDVGFANLMAGNLVSYSTTSGVTTVSSLGTDFVSVTGLDTDVVAFSDGEEFELNDDVTYIYVNHATNTGLSGGSLALSVDMDGDADVEYTTLYVTNVDGDALEVVFVAVGTPFAYNTTNTLVNNLVVSVNSGEYAVGDDVTLSFVNDGVKVAYVSEGTTLLVDLDNDTINGVNVTVEIGGVEVSATTVSGVATLVLEGLDLSDLEVTVTVG